MGDTAENGGCFYCEAKPIAGDCVVCGAACCVDHLLPDNTCSTGPEGDDLPLHYEWELEDLEQILEHIEVIDE